MMKNLRNAILVSFGIWSGLSAQEITKQQEPLILADTTAVTYESKLRPALSYDVDTDVKSLKKHWSTFLKKKLRKSFKTKDKVFLVTEDVVVNSISDKRLNLIVQLTQKATNSSISFSSAFGYDIYVDAKVYPKEFGELKKFAEAFLLESSHVYYTTKIDKFNDEISKLKKSNLKLNEKNLKNNNLIKEGDNLLVILNKSKEEHTSDSVKTLKKISKITKKQVSYKSQIVKNKGVIQENTLKIEELKREIALKSAKKASLKN